MLTITFVIFVATETPISTHEFERMGTQGSLVVVDDPNGRALPAALRALDDISRLMAPYGDSDVTRINHSGGKPVAVDAATLHVLRQAQQFSVMSHGLFDVTFAALAGVWKFDTPDAFTMPDPKRIRALLPKVDYKRVHLADGRVRMEGDAVLSLNGIAKGYGVDAAVRAMRAVGVHNFIIRLGGDLYASGTRGNRKWKIGVRDPRGSDSFAELEVQDAAFSTSGDYERFAVVDGVRYHHILDPRTGYPATASRAVSVLAPDCLTAEGLTKILFIEGRDKGYLAPGQFAVVVTANNDVWTSPGMPLHILHAPTR